MPSELSPEDPGQRPKAIAAEHIAVEASRLARMAGANDMHLLAYLIEMAVLEAWREASESDGAEAEPDPEALRARGTA